MNIYLHLESDEIEEVAAPIIAEICEWLKGGHSAAQLVNARIEEGAEGTRSEWDIGLTIETNKKMIFAKPLSFLYELAKTHKQEFVVGIYDAAGSTYENICYFGYEEGKPDPHEVASYLGLPK